MLQKKRADIITTRRIINNKGTLYIGIPKKFAIKHQLKKGDVVPIIIDSTMIRIIPVLVETDTSQLLAISLFHTIERNPCTYSIDVMDLKGLVVYF